MPRTQINTAFCILAVLLSLISTGSTWAESNATGSALSPDDAQALLAYHNRERAEVGVASLAWSGQLSAYAQEWADHLANDGCNLIHRSNTEFGENLYLGTAEHFPVVDAAVGWAEEKQHYHGEVLNGSNWYRSGHYTQMVWRGTTKMGCGQSFCNGNRIVVCNYQPAGNMMGESAY